MLTQSGASPLISIITATYNVRRLIPELVCSIAVQTFESYEWIIIDGASSDGTDDYLRTLADVRIKVISEKDAGIYDALNKGISLALGDYLYFIGADDRLADCEVLAKMQPLLKYGNSDIVTGQVDVGRRTNFKSVVGLKALILNSVHHQGAFYKRTLFDGFRYDVTEPVVADYQLNLDIYLDRKKWVDSETVVAVCGQAGISNKTEEYSLYRSYHAIRQKRLGVFLSSFFLVVGIANLARRRIFRR